MTQIDKLSKDEIKNLAQQALTAREKSRQSSKAIRREKTEQGLVQVSIWVPKDSPLIKAIREKAKQECEKHLKNLEVKSGEKSVV